MTGVDPRSPVASSRRDAVIARAVVHVERLGRISMICTSSSAASGATRGSPCVCAGRDRVGSLGSVGCSLRDLVITRAASSGGRSQTDIDGLYVEQSHSPGGHPGFSILCVGRDPVGSRREPRRGATSSSELCFTWNILDSLTVSMSGSAAAVSDALPRTPRCARAGTSRFAGWSVASSSCFRARVVRGTRSCARLRAAERASGGSAPDLDRQLDQPPDRGVSLTAA